MRSRFYGSAWAVLVLAALPVLASGATTQPGSGGPLTAADGRKFEQALAEIFRNAAIPDDDLLTVTIDQREINAYFLFQGATLFPAGVTDPHIFFLGEGRARVRVTVDLDQVRDQRTRSLLEPLRYVGGRLQVAVTGVLHARDGVGCLEIETVHFNAIPIPTNVLFELARYYSRTEQHPEGADFAQPFTLPYGIREVLVKVGQAVIVQ